MRLSWTQACCENCWDERNPGRRAARIVAGYRDEETCVYCGNWTLSGIYIRINPATASHPTPEKS